MDRQINLIIDIDNRKLTNYNGLVKQGDLVNLNITVLCIKEAVDLTGQIVKVFLKKEDEKKVEQTAVVSKNSVTCELDLQATTTVGKVLGELLISKDDGQVTSSTFTFEVEGAINSEVLEESKDSIETFKNVINTLNEANTLITKYGEAMEPIAGTTEAVAALNNIRAYIDSNLPALTDSNAKAENNIEKLESFENSLGNVTDLAKNVQTNTTDIGTLKENVENNTSQLKDCAKKDKTLQTGLNAEMLGGKKVTDIEFYRGQYTENLDDLTITGVYGIVKDKTTGTPVNEWGSIIVQQCPDDKAVYQIAMILNRITYTRFSYYDPTSNSRKWDKWKQLATSETGLLTYLNGWQGIAGNQEVVKCGNMVNIDVVLNNGSMTANSSIIQLPNGFRPNATLYFTAKAQDSSYNSQNIGVLIYTDGRVVFDGTPSGNTRLILNHTFYSK